MELSFITNKSHLSKNTTIAFITKDKARINFNREYLKEALQIDENTKSISVALNQKGNIVILNNFRTNNFVLYWPKGNNKGAVNVRINGQIDVESGNYSTEVSSVVLNQDSDSTPVIEILVNAL